MATNIKALKQGDLVEHTIRSYRKEGSLVEIPTAYCNEIVADNGAVDTRPILPINYDDIILFHEDGKPFHFGRRVKMRITDDTHENYYLAHYYVNDPKDEKPNESTREIKYEIVGKLRSNKLSFSLKAFSEKVERYNFDTTINISDSEQSKRIFEDISDSLTKILLEQKQR
jgi:hypothetical protein